MDGNCLGLCRREELDRIDTKMIDKYWKDLRYKLGKEGAYGSANISDQGKSDACEEFSACLRVRVMI